MASTRADHILAQRGRPRRTGQLTESRAVSDWAGKPIALIRSLANLGSLRGINEDQNHGITIALRAKEAPLREILTNCGEEPSVVLNNVKQGTGSYGYNAATGEYGDMIAMGILDPTKVTRTALQNAASIAGLMITTEAMVAEVPKKEEPMGSGHGGGCPRPADVRSPN